MWCKAIFCDPPYVSNQRGRVGKPQFNRYILHNPPLGSSFIIIIIALLATIPTVCEATDGPSGEQKQLWQTQTVYILSISPTNVNISPFSAVLQELARGSSVLWVPLFGSTWGGWQIPGMYGYLRQQTGYTYIYEIDANWNRFLKLQARLKKRAEIIEAAANAKSFSQPVKSSAVVVLLASLLAGSVLYS